MTDTIGIGSGDVLCCPSCEGTKTLTQTYAEPVTLSAGGDGSAECQATEIGYTCSGCSFKGGMLIGGRPTVQEISMEWLG